MMSSLLCIQKGFLELCATPSFTIHSSISISKMDAKFQISLLQQKFHFAKH
jgi:hypothetical protein